MIRWIVEDRLGTGAFHDVAGAGHTTLDARYLIDGSGNSEAGVRALVARGLDVVATGQPLVVACDFGVSRSNAIAAGILARWKDMSLDAAIESVISATGETNIKLGMIETVRAALRDGAEGAEDQRAILVTGGTGFLGRNLVSQLTQDSDADVLAPDRQTLDLLSGSTAIAAYLSKHRVGQVVHLAFPRVYTNIPAMGESLTILRSLIDACTARGATLTLLSGAVVFSGYKTQGLVADLETTPRAVHVYGETKLLEETLVRTCVQNSALAARIIRLAPTYGPGGLRPRFIRQFHEAIVAGDTIRVHGFINGAARLELLFISDAVAAISEIVSRNLQGEFHVGTGVQYSPLDVAREIAKLNGRALRHEVAPVDDLVSNVALGLHSSGEPLNWSPRIGLSEGLARTLSISGMVS